LVRGARCEIGQGFYHPREVAGSFEGEVTSTTVPEERLPNVRLAGRRHPVTGIAFVDTKKNPITWERPHAALDDEAIDEVERRLGVKLPPDYVAVARHAHGGQPSRAEITYQHPGIGPFGTAMSELLSLDPDYSNSLFSALSRLTVSGQLPKLVIPFGADAGGDYFCFDYRKTGPSGPPTVCYFAHETAPEESLIPLASSFTELLERFEPVI